MKKVVPRRLVNKLGLKVLTNFINTGEARTHEKTVIDEGSSKANGSHSFPDSQVSPHYSGAVDISRSSLYEIVPLSLDKTTALNAPGKPTELEVQGNVNTDGSSGGIDDKNSLGTVEDTGRILDEQAVVDLTQGDDSHDHHSQSPPLSPELTITDVQCSAQSTGSPTASPQVTSEQETTQAPRSPVSVVGKDINSTPLTTDHENLAGTGSMEPKIQTHTLVNRDFDSENSENARTSYSPLHVKVEIRAARERESESDRTSIKRLREDDDSAEDEGNEDMSPIGVNEVDSVGLGSPTATSSYKRRRRGAPRKILTGNRDPTAKDREMIAALAIPEYPSGIENYVLHGADFLDAHTKSQESVWRTQYKSLQGLDVLGWQNTQTGYNTDIIPLYHKVEKLRGDDAQYWLTSAVIACQDNHAIERMLTAGEIQSAVRDLKECDSLEIQMWLLILLRLAASCKTQGKLLTSATGDIYQFLLAILAKDDEHFYRAIKRRLISDSRGYDYFMPMAVAAHTRPLLFHTEELSFREEARYRKHARLLVAGYRKSRAVSRNFTEDLYQRICKTKHTLTTHEMAIEIFIDSAKHGLFDGFVTKYVNAKWARVFSLYLSRPHFPRNIPYLLHVLYHAPLAVADRIPDIEVGCERTLNYFLKALENILDTRFLGHKSRELQIEPTDNQLASQCAKCLDVVLKADLHHPNILPPAFSGAIRSEDVMIRILQYILIAPYCEGLLNDDVHRDLYEATWSLIISMMYTFPMMISTLTDVACDEEAPLCLRGHAAMYIGTMVAVAKTEISKGQLKLVHDAVKEYAAEATDVKTRQLRLELAFRLDVFLFPEKYGMKTTDSPSKVHVGSHTMFERPKFEENETDSDRKTYLDIVAFLTTGEEVPLHIP